MSLLHNPLAEMWGPLFLVTFWIVTIVLAVTVRRAVRSLDQTEKSEPIGPGLKLDTPEIAYLRGGHRALLETTLFDLRRRGYLKVETETSPRRTDYLEKNPDGPSDAHLDGFERRVLEQFDSPVPILGIPRNRELLAAVADRADEIESRLLQEELLVTSEVRSRARMIGWVAGTLLLGLAGYKLWAATLNGHRNIGFLIISSIVALLIVAICSSLPRPTRRGRDYLDRLKLTLGGRPTRPIEEMEPLDVASVAILGFAALQGVPEAATWRSLGAYTGGDGGLSYSSCGSSCGGGGCGGGGCGGGCGGCGS